MVRVLLSSGVSGGGDAGGVADVARAVAVATSNKWVAAAHHHHHVNNKKKKKKASSSSSSAAENDARKVKVNKANDDGATPLYAAALGGHLAIVRELVSSGADLNQATNDGRTPLFAVVTQLCDDILHAPGGDIEIEIGFGVTCTTSDEERHHREVDEWTRDREALVRELISAGADVDKADADGRGGMCGE